MIGIKDPADVTVEYCAMLMMEYTALDCAQIFSLLKNYGDIVKTKRKQMMRELCRRQYARKILYDDGRSYFISRNGIEIKGLLYAQIQCFWVLLAYLDRVDHHCATGTASSLITMEIEGRDYSILYVERGKELMCSYLMEKGGVTRYFVVIDDPAQIPLIKNDQIHAFVTLDECRQLQYYTAERGEKS